MHKLPANILQLFKQEVGGRGGGGSSFSWADVFLVDKYLSFGKVCQKFQQLSLFYSNDGLLLAPVVQKVDNIIQWIVQ